MSDFVQHVAEGAWKSIVARLKSFRLRGRSGGSAEFWERARMKVHGMSSAKSHAHWFQFGQPRERIDFARLNATRFGDKVRREESFAPPNLGVPSKKAPGLTVIRTERPYTPPMTQAPLEDALETYQAEMATV